MSEKVAERLRRYHFEAGQFFVGLKTKEGWLGDKFYLDQETNDGHDIYNLCLRFLEKYWLGEGAYQVQVTALDPKMVDQQLRLFDSSDLDRINLCHTMDLINRRYGEFALSPARLMLRSKMPNVIAPAWKPSGHRQTI